MQKFLPQFPHIFWLGKKFLHPKNIIWYYDSLTSCGSTGEGFRSIGGILTALCLLKVQSFISIFKKCTAAGHTVPTTEYLSFTAYLQGTIYGRNFEFMQKTFDKSGGSNSTIESVPGDYITLRHILTLSWPPILKLQLLKTWKIGRFAYVGPTEVLPVETSTR